MRSDDHGLLRVAEHLKPDLAARLKELVAADGRAVRIVDLEHAAQRADDLAKEAVRQVRGLQQAYDRLRARSTP